jgi:hypothetical protein
MRLFVFSFLLFLSTTAFSQKVLRLDTPKNPSKAQYLIGSRIIFKLEKNKENDIWYSEIIKDFDIDRGLIIFDSWEVHYQDIIGLRNPYAHRGAKVTAKMLEGFGLGLIVFSTLGRVTKDCPNCNEALVVGGGSLLIGWIIDKLTGVKNYKIGKRNRLHLLDLSFKPAAPARV